VSTDADARDGADDEQTSSDDMPTDIVPTDLEEDTDTHDTQTSSSDIGKAETMADRSIGTASTDPGLHPRAGDSQDTVGGRPSARGRAGDGRGEKRAVLRGAVIAGRYRIERLIARGSMSRVYEAQQTSVHRPVALKLMSERFATDDQAVARFQREASVLAQIDHPNVVAVYDIGVTDAGEHFLVMEHVDGEPMSDLIKEHSRLGPARCVGLLLQVARALARVHGAGVIHRDLKPKNVLVTSGRSGVEVAKVVDFGLAKVTAEQPGEQALTRSGTILGTPEYMAPEQVRGTKVDHRADVYSLGCGAYEMLTGRPQFIGEEMSILYRQMNEQPVPMREICPEADVPPSFQEFVDGALAKNPDERYEGASEVYAALLRASDIAGVKRSHLRLTESLFDDPAVVAARAENRAKARTDADAAATTLSMAVPDSAPGGRRGLLLLGAVVIAALAMVAGVLLDRSVAGGSAERREDGAGAAAAELLLVNSRPAGATVEVDGDPLPETTPTALRGITEGQHLIHLRKEGYGDVERRVAIAAGARTVVDVDLPPRSREVLVRTVPAGALVFLDGRLASSHTPARLTLTGDDFHAIRFEKNGFEPHVVHVTPDDSAAELNFTLELEKRPIGWLWVDSNDTAEVWIDGLDTGFVAPTFGLRLEVGRHAVQLRDSAGARSGSVEVEVRQGESTHLTLGLREK